MSFGPDNLPYASVVDATGRRFAVVRIGDEVLDLGAAGVVPELFVDGTLDALLAGGPATWAQVRAGARRAIESGAALLPLTGVRPVLGFTVADYVDFYASREHATHAGEIFRPGSEPLPPNWTGMPLGYHGRAGTVVASDTEVRRPRGHLSPGQYESSNRLDFEAEVAFVVGAPSRPGEPVDVAAADEHVFGVCLLNDWSARDIQRWETVPLGPFLGKSFATSVSPWITPLAALEHARVPVAQSSGSVAAHLADTEVPHGLDLDLRIELNGHEISRPQFAGLYWSYAQLVAHLTSNGAPLRTGDLLASGTVSGVARDRQGCLLEITWNGRDELVLPDGASRTWLLDGDEITITASAGSITLGDVQGRIVSA